MKKCSYFLIFFVLLRLAHSLHAELEPQVNYEIVYVGLNRQQDACILEAIQSISQLVKLQERPPMTVAALKRRTENDLPNIVKALNNFGFYSPAVEYDIVTTTAPVEVRIEIEKGPEYPLVYFEILAENNQNAELLESISLFDIGIELNQTALPENLLKAEDALLKILAEKGYPLANFSKREVIADQTAHNITVVLHVNTGPLVYFGETIIEGNEDVNEKAIRKKIEWCEGCIFDPEKIRQTQKSIEEMGIFRSVVITYPDEVDSEMLPMRIEVSESKLRTIGLGISYTTQFGPGVALQWEHRNIGSGGEKLSFKTDIWASGFKGSLTYMQPDFLRRKQNLLWIGEIDRDTTKGYDEYFYSLSGIIETQITEKLKLSYGGQIKQLRAEKADSSRSHYYTLVKAPLQVRWSNANSLLDPSRGHTIHYKLTPTLQVNKNRAKYAINLLTATSYIPMTHDENFIFASKITFGTIPGSAFHKIPLPERFFTGCENTMRGYHYMTVSPIVNKKPIGGRSMMVFSFEPRFRFSENWGGVLFFEVGNVYRNTFPNFHEKQLKSVGAGIRYITPIGPLRLDVGFPLDRRKGVDGPCQVYFSIGPSF